MPSLNHVEAATPKEAGAISRTLTNAFLSTDKLDDAISDLHDRLGPVLSDNEPDEKGYGEPAQDSKCQLAADLDCIAARNFAVVSRIRRILDQLEL